jgi:hypothetical protein
MGRVVAYAHVCWVQDPTDCGVRLIDAYPTMQECRVAASAMGEVAVLIKTVICEDLVDGTKEEYVVNKKSVGSMK